MKWSASISDMPRQWSPWFDLKILLRTPRAVFLGEGATRALRSDAFLTRYEKADHLHSHVRYCQPNRSLHRPSCNSYFCSVADCEQ